MNDIMQYKSYEASVHFDADDNVFHGKILNIDDLVIFEGFSINKLKLAFKEAAEDYLQDLRVINDAKR